MFWRPAVADNLDSPNGDTADAVRPSAISPGDPARFARVFEKARRGEPITVGFLGGSITQGYASSDEAHRYADLVTAWWRQTFPKTRVTEIDAGVGGTGSNYGCLRVRHDLLSKAPDVVLVEFAVNDDDTRQAALTLEGVVRQVLAAPQTPACMLLFMSHAGANAQDWHRRVGEHYGLPMVSFRDGLAAEIKAGRLTWEDVMHDDIHPNDRGHAMAARYVTAMLDTLLKAGPGPAEATAALPAPLYTDLYAKVDSHDADTLSPTHADGWAFDAATASWKADKPGSVIEFKTAGRGVALMYYRVHKDFGRVKVTVDGGHAQTFDGWFNQTWGGFRQTSDVATDLPDGEHAVRVELLADKAPQSNGHEFRILGLAALGFDAPPVATGAAAYVWKDVPVGGGGFVSGVYAHPTAPHLFYCKTDIGGAYRREGDGPWVPMVDWVDNDHWNYSGIESVALDPNDPDAVYLAAGTYTSGWSGAGAFLLSHDRGRTWKTVPAAFKMGGNEDGRNQGERLAVDPNDGRVLYFGSRKDGLWKSVDRGETWAAVQGFPLPKEAKQFGAPFVVFDAASGRRGTPTPTIVVGCSSPRTPLLRSVDGGASWSAVAGVPTDFLPQRAAFGAGGALFVSFGNGVGPNGVTNGAVYRLDAGANTWTDVSPVRPSAGDVFGYSGVTVDGHDANLMVVSTLDRWARVDDIFRSRDGGTTWKSLHAAAVRDASAAPWITFGNPGGAGFGHWISTVAMDPADPQHLMYGTGWGMWESRDTDAADAGKPTHWTFAGTGIDEGVMTDVISPPQGAPVLSTLWDLNGFRHEDVDRSPPTGFFKPWTGRATSIDFAEAKPDVVVQVFGGQVLGKGEDAAAGGAVSADNGRTWTLFAHRPRDAVDGTVAVAADAGRIVWTPQDAATVVSADRGRSWTAAAGLPWNLAVVSDRVNAKAFYAFDPATGTVYASDDAAASFHATTTLPPGEGALRVDYDRPGDLWLARPDGLLRSTDAGRSFARVAGLDGVVCVGFGKSPADRGGVAVFAAARVGGHFGIYRSDDAGGRWTRINDDAHQFMQIAAISGDPRVGGRVYLASRSRGLIRGDPADAK